MSGACAASASLPTVWSLTTGGSFASFRSGAISAIDIHFNTDGTITRTAANVDNTASVPANWYFNTTTSIGNGYFVRVTCLSGDPASTGFALNTWVALSSVQTIGTQINFAGTATGVHLFEISTNGYSVVASFQATILASRT